MRRVQASAVVLATLICAAFPTTAPGWEFFGTSPPGPVAVNDSGEITGWERTGSGSLPPGVPWTWTAAGGKQTLPAPVSCPSAFSAAIANNGDVGGWCIAGEQDANENRFPVVWEDGTFRDLGAPPITDLEGDTRHFGQLRSVSAGGRFTGDVSVETGPMTIATRAIAGETSGGWSYAAAAPSAGRHVTDGNLLTYRGATQDSFVDETALPVRAQQAPRADGWVWISDGDDAFWKDGVTLDLQWPAGAQSAGRFLTAVSHSGPSFGLARDSSGFDRVVVFDSPAAQGRYFVPSGSSSIYAISSDGTWAVNENRAIFHRVIAETDFTVTRTAPGRYVFDSLATGAGDRAWDFGDGEAAIGPSVTHDFALPGTYSVTHTFTPTTGSPVGTKTKTVTVDAPALDVSIALPQLGSEPLDVDATVDAQVTVTAGSEGVGALGDLTFTDAILTAAPGGRVDITGAAVPPAFSLEPGESETFTVQVKGAARGPVTLRSAIAGVDAAGNPIDRHREREIRVGRDLKVTVTAEPAAVALDEVDTQTQRPKRKPVTVTVKVENLAEEEIDDANLDLTLRPAFTVARNPSAPDPLQLRSGPLPDSGPGPPLTSEGARAIDLGDLAIGAVRTLRFQAEAVDKADVDVQALVLGAATGRTARGVGETRVRIGAKFRLRFEAKILGDPPPATIRGGDAFTIKGELENLSPDETIVVRVAGRRSGNVVEGTVSDLENPDPCGCGLVKKLGPGDKVPVWAQMHTSKSGGTRANIEFRIEGWVVSGDGSETAISTAEIIVAPGSDAHRMAVATADPPPAPVSWTEGAWILSDSFAQGYGRAVQGLIDMADMAGQFIGTATAPWTWPAEYQRMMVWLQGYTREVYTGLTPEEQAAWREDTEAALSTFLRVSREEAHGLFDRAIQESFQGLTTSWYTNDTRGLLTWVGGFAGENVDALLDVASSGVALCKLLRRGGVAIRVVARQAEKQAATLPSRIAAAGRRGLLPGDLLSFAHATRLYAIDIAMDAKLRAYASSKGLIIAMRDRGAGSIKRLAEGFLAKIQAIKAKNVSQLDIDWLGFAPQHLDVAMIKQMPSETAMNDLLTSRGASDELRTKVLARWKQRKGEWDGTIRPELEAFDQQGKVWVPSREFGLNPLENGIPVENPGAVYDFRDFRLSKAGQNGYAATTDGLDAYIPEMHVRGRYRGFTGDMDPIAILDQNLRVPDLEARKQIYRELAELGFQHPESLTWDDEAGRLKYLFDYDVANPNGESLLAYMPNGSRRAVKFDMNKSWWEQGGAGRVFLMLHGAHVVLETALPNRSPFAAPPDPATNPYFRPGGPGGARFSTDPDSPMLRTLPDGTLEAWTTAGGWQPFGAPAGGGGTGAPRARMSAGRPTRMLPQTALAADVPAGATELPIIARKDLRLVRGRNAWFRRGQRIVVDPGGRSQERAIVTGLGSIRLRSPTTKAHQAGEMVGVAPRAGGRPRFRGRPKVTVAVLTARAGRLRLLVQNGHRFRVAVGLRVGGRSARARLGPWRRAIVTLRSARRPATAVVRVSSSADRARMRQRLR